MKKFVLGAVCLAATVGFAGFAVAGLADNVIGNTLKITDASGTGEMKFKADGTVSGSDPSGKAHTGTWKEVGTQVCVTDDADKKETCADVDASKKVGDKWTGKNAMTGGDASFEIVAGQ